MGYIHFVTDRELTRTLMLRVADAVGLSRDAIAPWRAGAGYVESSRSAAIARAQALQRRTREPIALIVDSGIASTFRSEAERTRIYVEESVRDAAHAERCFVSVFHPEAEIVFWEAAGAAVAETLQVAEHDLLLKPRVTISQALAGQEPGLVPHELNSLNVLTARGVVTTEQLVQVTQFSELATWLRSIQTARLAA